MEALSVFLSRHWHPSGQTRYDSLFIVGSKQETHYMGNCFRLELETINQCGSALVKKREKPVAAGEKRKWVGPARKVFRIVASLTVGVIALALVGCKERISPHVAPEADAEVLVAGLSAARQQVGQPAPKFGSGSVPSKTVLTLNNAPAPNELFELEITQRLVELFEQRNPDVQIEFSTWRFTPESLYERAKTHTLTDVVEVTLDQMQPIMDLSLAADLTSYLGNTPEIQSMNAAVLGLTSREGRLFGVPVELHTMAIFYNRQMLDDVLHPKPKSEPKKGEKKSTEKKGAKGGDESGRFEDGEDLARPGATPYVIAQARRYGSSYYEYFGTQRNTDEQQDDSYSRRGEQQVENEYQVTPRPRFRWPFRAVSPLRTPTRPTPRPSLWRRTAPQEESDVREEGEPQQLDDIESARPGAVRSAPLGAGQVLSDIESARPGTPSGKPSEVTTAPTVREEVTGTVVKEDLTTAVTLTEWAKNWEDFIKLAVKLTDHEKAVYGYAPVLFAEDGGREFIQWAVLAGLDASQLPSAVALQRLRAQPGTDALQFLRDLRWRYDITPPADKCYGDNVLRMFAQGKVAMVMLPATKESLRRLMRAGMSPDNIGIAPLPAGPAARYHLTFGRCLIVNSQVDHAKRLAAAKWIRFLLDPEVTRLREQYLFREQDLTGVPKVPLFNKQKQEQVYTVLKPYRLLPVFTDYEDAVTTGLVAEPARLREELYEELAKEIRPAVELSNSDVPTIVQNLVKDFESRYLRQAEAEKLSLESYIRLFTTLRR